MSYFLLIRSETCEWRKPWIVIRFSPASSESKWKLFANFDFDIWNILCSLVGSYCKPILAIKKRLNEAVDKINISANKLKDELNDKYGYEINYETLNNTLNLSKPKSLDTICVIALCRYFNLDTAFVLSEPNNPNSEIYTNENQFVSERFAILSEPKYFGYYYWYFYSPKKTNNLIDNFHLKINKEYGKTVARLTIN